MNTRIDANSREWHEVYRQLRREFYDQHQDVTRLNLRLLEKWLATHGMHVIKADSDGHWEWIELVDVDWTEVVLRWG